MREAGETLEQHRCRARNCARQHLQGQGRRQAEAANADEPRFLAAASHDLQPLNAARLFTLGAPRISTPTRRNWPSASTHRSKPPRTCSMRCSKPRASTPAATGRKSPCSRSATSSSRSSTSFPCWRRRAVCACTSCRGIVRAQRSIICRPDRADLLERALHAARRHATRRMRRRRHGQHRSARHRARHRDRTPAPDLRRVSPPRTPVAMGERGSAWAWRSATIIARMLGHRLETDSRRATATGSRSALPATHRNRSQSGAVLRRYLAGRSGEFVARAVPEWHRQRDPRRHAGLAHALGRELRHSAQCGRSTKCRIVAPSRPDRRDYHLDDPIDGLAALDRLREAFDPPPPGALITADASLELKASARERGYALLRKPVKPAALRALIAQLGRSSTAGARPVVAT